MEKVTCDFYSKLFDSNVHLPPCHPREDGFVIPSVLPSEVRHAIKSMKNRTAPCPDRIRPEHLKNVPPPLVNTLARLFTRYLSECKVPSQWKTSRTVLLYKKGDPQNIGNYRSICLLISPFYDDITIDVRRGVRQGDTVSPKQFTATLEDVMRRLECDNMEVQVDGRLLHHLRFADDIVLIIPNIGQAERMLTNFDDACGKIGLQLNLTKTMFMRNGLVPDAPFSLNGTNISECSSYVYPGREVNMMNDFAPELGRRKRAAWGAYKSIEDVVKKTKNIRLRAHLFNTTRLRGKETRGIEGEKVYINAPILIRPTACRGDEKCDAIGTPSKEEELITHSNFEEILRESAENPSIKNDRYLLIILGGQAPTCAKPKKVSALTRYETLPVHNIDFNCDGTVRRRGAFPSWKRGIAQDAPRPRAPPPPPPRQGNTRVGVKNQTAKQKQNIRVTGPKVRTQVFSPVRVVVINESEQKAKSNASQVNAQQAADAPSRSSVVPPCRSDCPVVMTVEKYRILTDDGF
ncbi:hypothetical protein ANCCEY_07198 [Ancylostoma ceylanicum]|uniref:Reverse transcriptase domain-containing protein n=1 Tax=Ancylostoma ceylanicum TaxID=53326 RepID=A0A0D6LNQ8_9BILA|nr:hypothetical protein ANCCEY_07198 [Ancylostoma ceylanicum]